MRPAREAVDRGPWRLSADLPHRQIQAALAPREARRFAAPANLVGLSSSNLHSRINYAATMNRQERQGRQGVLGVLSVLGGSTRPLARPSWGLGAALVAFAVVIAALFGARSLRAHDEPAFEVPLVSWENALNPVPSPDGTKIAYVRTGWGREGGSGGRGRSNLISEVMVVDSSGRALAEKPLADAFLSGWTAEGKNLVCYRDWRCFLVDLDGAVTHRTSITEEAGISRTERATYLASHRTMAWTVERTIRTEKKEEIVRSEHRLGTLLLPSPDERYLAVVEPENAYSSLRVHDTRSKTWADLGFCRIHPCSDWDYTKPSWNPWFRDSSRLAFSTEGAIVVCTPDGKSEQKIVRLEEPHGLATPSPDGKWVAYVTFTRRPRKNRADLTFFGDATVFVVRTDGGSKPVAVTRPSPHSIMTLHWLDAKTIVFDRLADEELYEQARLWKVTLWSDLLRSGGEK